jgi:hypothetical protein
MQFSGQNRAKSEGDLKPRVSVQVDAGHDALTALG